METGRHYLVTGGLGFLGSAVTRTLVGAGQRVRVLDDLSRGSERRLARHADAVDVVIGDVRNASTVRDCLSGIDTVCHFAGINGTRHFYERPAEVLEVGVKGIVNVLDGCLAQGVRDLILVSSSEVYQTAPAIPTDETVALTIPDPHNPRYSYAAAKIVSELLVLNYGRTHFDRVVVCRPHNVYGPDMGRAHVIPELAQRTFELASGGPGPLALPIQGTGRESRALVYIDDFVDGMLHVLRLGKHLEIYNIGTDEEHTVEALAREIGRHYGRRVEIVPSDRRPGSTPRRCPDIAKLRALGFRPRHTLRQGLHETLDWYDRNRESVPTRARATLGGA